MQRPCCNGPTFQEANAAKSIPGSAAVECGSPGRRPVMELESGRAAQCCWCSSETGLKCWPEDLRK
jgi:hypothetical protein